MKICPACGFENLVGAEECTECSVSLTLEDTNPAYKVSDIHHVISDPISNVTLKQPLIVKPTTSVFETIAMMKKNKQGCVLVVDKNKVAGIFTERDVLKRVSKGTFDLSEIEVQNLMTASPEVLDETDSIAFAINKMAMGNFRNVPIRKQDGTFTNFSVKDAIRYLF